MKRTEPAVEIETPISVYQQLITFFERLVYVSGLPLIRPWQD